MSQYTTDTYPIIEYNASTYPPASELVTVRKDLAAPFPQGFYGKKNILVADAGSPAFLSIPITTPKVTPVVSLDNLKYISRFETSSNSTPNEKKGPYLCWISGVPGGNPILRQNFVVMASRSGRTGKLYMTTDPNVHSGVYNNIEGSGLSGDQRQEILYMGSDYGLKFLNIAIIDLNRYRLFKNSMPNPGSARFEQLITTDDNAKIRCNEFRFYLNHPPSVTSSAFAEVTTNFPSFRGASDTAKYIGEKWDGSVPAVVEIKTTMPIQNVDLSPGAPKPHIFQFNRNGRRKALLPIPVEGKIHSYPIEFDNRFVVPREGYTYLTSEANVGTAFGAGTGSPDSDAVLMMMWHSDTPGGEPKVDEFNRPVVQFHSYIESSKLAWKQVYSETDQVWGRDIEQDCNFTLRGTRFNLNPSSMDGTINSRGSVVFPIVTKTYFVNVALVSVTTAQIIAANPRAPYEDELRTITSGDNVPGFTGYPDGHLFAAIIQFTAPSRDDYKQEINDSLNDPNQCELSHFVKTFDEYIEENRVTLESPAVRSQNFSISSSGNASFRGARDTAQFIGAEWDGSVPSHVEIIEKMEYAPDIDYSGEYATHVFQPGTEHRARRHLLRQPIYGKIDSYPIRLDNRFIMGKDEFFHVPSPAINSPDWVERGGAVMVGWMSDTPGGPPRLGAKGQPVVEEFIGLEKPFGWYQVYSLTDVNTSIDGNYESKRYIDEYSNALVFPVITKTYFWNMANVSPETSLRIRSTDQAGRPVNNIARAPYEDELVTIQDVDSYWPYQGYPAFISRSRGQNLAREFDESRGRRPDYETFDEYIQRNNITVEPPAPVSAAPPSPAGAAGSISGANIAGTYDTAGTPRPTAGKTSSKDNNTPFKLVAPPNNNWFCRFVLDDKRRDMQTTVENALLEIAIKPAAAAAGEILDGAIGNISLENMFKPLHELAGFLPLEIEFTTNAQRANVPGEAGSSSETTRTANAWAAAAAAESGASGTGSTSSSSSQSGSSSSATQPESAADCPIQPSDYNSTYEFLGDTYRSKYNQFGYTIMDGGSGYRNTKLIDDAITYSKNTDDAIIPPKCSIPFTVPPVNTVDDWDHVDGAAGPFSKTKNYAYITWSSNTFVVNPDTLDLYDQIPGSVQGLWVIWVSDDPGGPPKENEKNYIVTKVNTDFFNAVRLINDTRYWDNGYTDAPRPWNYDNEEPGVTVRRGGEMAANLHNPPGEESEVRFVNFALVEKSYEAWTDYDPNNGFGTAGTLRYPPGSGEFDALVIPNDEQIIYTTDFGVIAQYPASQGYTGDNNTSTPPPGSSSNPSAPDDRTPDVPSIFVPPASEIEVHWNLQDGVLPANIGGSPKHANEDRTYLRISAPNVDWEVGFPAEITRFTDSVSIVAKKLSEAKEELTWKPLEKGSDQPANIAIAYTNGEINVERLFRDNPDADAHCGSGAPFEFEYNNIEDNIQSLLGKSEGSFADDLHRVGIGPNYYPLDIGADPFGRAWDNDGPEAKHFWSALAVSAVLLHSGMRPLRTQSALDYAMYGNEVDWRSWINVRKNDIAVFKFKGASGGHVGFIRSVDLAKNEVTIAGGNQSNSFKETGYRITSTDMYLLTVRRKWSDPGDDYKLL